MKQAVFVFDCYISEKSKLYLYFVATLVMKYAVFVFDCYVSDKRTACFVFYCCVSDRRKLYFVFDGLLSVIKPCCSFL